MRLPGLYIFFIQFHLNFKITMLKDQNKQKNQSTYCYPNRKGWDYSRCFNLIFQQTDIMVCLTQYMICKKRQNHRTDFTLLYALRACFFEISEFYGFF